jgi:DNA-binding IclR family transcriptional regulator
MKTTRRTVAKRTTADQIRVINAVLRTVERYEIGARMDEIVALSGLSDDRAWRALERTKREGLLENRGDYGWFPVRPERALEID